MTADIHITAVKRKEGEQFLRLFAFALLELVRQLEAEDAKSSGDVTEQVAS